MRDQNQRKDKSEADWWIEGLPVHKLDGPLHYIKVSDTRKN